MKFSGNTIGTSVALSALPDDFASPLAGTVSDLNTYFIFMFAVIFVEKLIVLIGTKISLAYIIPFACVLYIFTNFLWTKPQICIIIKSLSCYKLEVILWPFPFLEECYERAIFPNGDLIG